MPDEREEIVKRLDFGQLMTALKSLGVVLAKGGLAQDTYLLFVPGRKQGVLALEFDRRAKEHGNEVRRFLNSRLN